MSTLINSEANTEHETYTTPDPLRQPGSRVHRRDAGAASQRDWTRVSRQTDIGPALPAIHGAGRRPPQRRTQAPGR